MHAVPSNPNQNPNRILLVDDDNRGRELLRRFLVQQGFEVLQAEDGVAMARLRLRETIDLIVLDVMLPGEDGLSLCKRLRAEGDATPIIMLTAKGDDNDRIQGLEEGADDYLGKPCNPQELVARIHAVLRRRPPPEPPAAPSSQQELVCFGALTFDLQARRLHRGEEELPLTTCEFALLKALVRNARKPLSREMLSQSARGRSFSPLDRSLDVQISRLRKLIEDDHAQPRFIQTVWGVGYVFVPDDVA